MTLIHTCRASKLAPRIMRSDIYWFAEICNSQCLSHFAASFIASRAEVSIVKGMFECFGPRTTGCIRLNPARTSRPPSISYTPYAAVSCVQLSTRQLLDSLEYSSYHVFANPESFPTQQASHCYLFQETHHPCRPSPDSLHLLQPKSSVGFESFAISAHSDV